MDLGALPDQSLLQQLVGRPRWHADAACREHPGVTWFPGTGDHGREAKAVCQQCLVLDECRTWALGQDNSPCGLAGIWAGLSRQDRVTLQAASTPKAA